ncbi:aldo/keto reductase [Brachyspira intermedia]|uniref:aldo/keto reductase n=1 Tax=Brachyspira intermedia TaxID=84377 RepID=UPI003004D769
MKTIKLNNGFEIPMEGFGVFQVPNHDECRKAVLNAIETGYRYIDTASAYLNEEAVGKAVKESGVRREDIFIATKLWVQDAGYENTKRAFEVSMKKLGLDYLDVYLLHQAYGDYYGSWRAMEEFYKEGRIKALGVCNFDSLRLVDLCMNFEVKPVIDQVELHPFFQRQELIEVMKEYDVLPQAWGPLAEAGQGIFENEVLLKIAKKYNKTVAQVILRWNIERGVMIIPKTVHKNRMEENINIWDFKLDKEDIESIAKLDIGYSKIIDHTSYKTAKFLNEYKIHN